jgi:hypothetical protein
LIGTFGLLARMVVFVLVGLFLIKAAVKYDPSEAVGIDGAAADVGRIKRVPLTAGAQDEKDRVHRVPVGYAGVVATERVRRARRRNGSILAQSSGGILQPSFVNTRPIRHPSPETVYDGQTLQALTRLPDLFAGPIGIVTGGGSVWMSIAGAPRWRG